MSFLQEQATGLKVSIYVQPKSSRTRLVGLHGDALKLCITAAPVDGKANEAVIVFFAKLFHLPKAAVSIQSGVQSRNKTLFVSGLNREKALTLISQICPELGNEK